MLLSQILAHNRLDQPIGAIPAAVQNLNGILLGIEKDEEIIVSEQTHLLHSLIFGHRHNDKLFTPTDQREQLTGLIDGKLLLFDHFGSRAPVSAPAVVLTFVTVDLSLDLVERGIERGVNIILYLFL
jgi:hypothetical protein